VDAPGVKPKFGPSGTSARRFFTWLAATGRKYQLREAKRSFVEIGATARAAAISGDATLYRS